MPTLQGNGARRMRTVKGNRRLDHHGSTHLAGMGKCNPCRNNDHDHCPRRAIDNMTGDWASCFCADTGHRTDNTWREIFR